MADTAQARHRTLSKLPQRLHHYAFVVKDQEENRKFFEDVLGIPLVATWCERAFNSVLQREIDYCHTFYGLGDGGALAFFQYADPEAYELLKPQAPETGRHIAFRVDRDAYEEIKGRLVAADIEPREIDHGYCRSMYVSSPEGQRLEFTVDPPDVDRINAMRLADCHAELDRWLKGDRRTNNDDRPK